MPSESTWLENWSIKSKNSQPTRQNKSELQDAWNWNKQRCSKYPLSKWRGCSQSRIQGASDTNRIASQNAKDIMRQQGTYTYYILYYTDPAGRHKSIATQSQEIVKGATSAKPCTDVLSMASFHWAIPLIWIGVKITSSSWWRGTSQWRWRSRFQRTCLWRCDRSSRPHLWRCNRSSRWTSLGSDLRLGLEERRSKKGILTCHPHVAMQLRPWHHMLNFWYWQTQRILTNTWTIVTSPNRRNRFFVIRTLTPRWNPIPATIQRSGSAIRMKHWNFRRRLTCLLHVMRNVSSAFTLSCTTATNTPCPLTFRSSRTAFHARLPHQIFTAITTWSD